MPSTSTHGAALGVEGTLLQVETGSPATFQTIANAADWSLPTKANTVEVTNFGDKWVRRFATLLDMGDVTFKVFFVPTEETHDAATGLRFLMINRILSNFKAVYPDADESEDVFPAFVTNVSVTGKVGGVFEGSVTLSNNGAPTLA